MRVSHPERRKLTRLPLEVFLRLRILGADTVEFAETRDVSARGLYFHTRAQITSGQELECVLVLPSELTLAPEPLFVGCRGKVLRTNERLPGQKLGVAMEIHSYDFSLPGTLSNINGNGSEQLV
jgi:PilZ domain